MASANVDRQPSARFIAETEDTREERILHREIRRLQYEWEIDLKHRELYTG